MHSNQQALSGRVTVAQGTRSAHFARGQPQAKEPGLDGLQHVVGQPIFVSRICVQRHHLSHQVARLCGAWHHIEECGAIGPQRGVQHLPHIVIEVAHQHAQAYVGTERRRALVGLQLELQGAQLLEGAQLLVFEGALCEHHPTLCTHGHLRRRCPQLQVTGNNGAGDLAI
ncbi:uncharacterized protein LOC144329547 [Macaca mulatta]